MILIYDVLNAETDIESPEEPLTRQLVSLAIV